MLMLSYNSLVTLSLTQTVSGYRSPDGFSLFLENQLYVILYLQTSSKRREICCRMWKVTRWPRCGRAVECRDTLRSRVGRYMQRHTSQIRCPVTRICLCIWQPAYCSTYKFTEVIFNIISFKNRVKEKGIAVRFKLIFWEMLRFIFPFIPGSPNITVEFELLSVQLTFVGVLFTRLLTVNNSQYHASQPTSLNVFKKQHGMKDSVRRT